MNWWVIITSITNHWVYGSGVTTNFAAPRKLFVKGPLTGSENFYSPRSGAAPENKRKCILGSTIAATVWLVPPVQCIHADRTHGRLANAHVSLSYGRVEA